MRCEVWWEREGGGGVALACAKQRGETAASSSSSIRATAAELKGDAIMACACSFQSRKIQAAATRARGGEGMGREGVGGGVDHLRQGVETRW